MPGPSGSAGNEKKLKLKHFSQPKSVFVVQLIFKVCKSDNNIGMTTPNGGFCVLLR